MRLLADENVPLPSVRLLREAGVDIESVAEHTPGAPDLQVLTRAASGDRILITFDRDFGELIYHRGAPVPPGVVYLRLVPASPDEPGQLLLSLLARADVRLPDRFFASPRRDRRGNQESSGPELRPGPAGPYRNCTGTRANRDKLDALINEMLESVRCSHLYNRLRRLDALEKASEAIEKVHDLSSPAARPRLEDIFYQLRLARQGR